MTIKFDIPSVEQIQLLGAAFGANATGGELVMLNGPLGAGKTTMTQGIARGIGIETRISSPTFVIAQNYHGPKGVDLVHVDAYRLDSIEDLDALDLDSSLDESLTVVEWGEGKVEVLSADRIEIDIQRPVGSDSGFEPEDLYGDAPRTLEIRAFGESGKAYLERVLATFEANVSAGNVGD